MSYPNNPLDPNAQTPPPPIPPGHVLPLNYVPARSMATRPGSMIAVGIIGLLVGATSIVVSITVGMTWWKVGSGSLPPPPPPQPAPLTAATHAPYTGQEIVAARGLPRAKRQELIAQFKLDGVYRDDFAAMLDRLLAEYGQDIFARGTPSTPTVVTGQPGYLDDSRTFQVPGGQIALKPNRAEFSANGELYIVTERATSAAGTTNIPEHTSAFATDETMQAIRAASPKLTPQQLGFIAQMLPTARSTYDEPRYGHGAFAPVAVESLTSDGVLTVAIGPKEYFVLADGRNTPKDAFPLGVNGTSGMPYWQPAPYVPQWPGSPTLMFAQAVHCWLGIPVALLLMFGSYRVLTDTPQGTLLLYRWVVLKGLLIVLEVVLAGGYILTVDPSDRSSVHYQTERGATGMLTSVVVQSILPIVVLTLLKSASVQSWAGARGVAIRLIDRDKWSAMAHRILRGPWALVPRLAGLGLILVAVLNAVMAPLADATPMAIFHAAVACITGAAAAMLLRLRPQAAATSILAIALLVCPAAADAQTKPADPAAVQQITDLLDHASKAPQKTRTAEYDAAIDKIVAQDAPAQLAVVDWLAAHPTSDLANRFGIKWRDTGINKDQALHDRALAEAKKILEQVPPDTRRFEFGMLLALGDSDEAAPMWVKISLSSSVMKRAADAWIQKNESGSKAMIAELARRTGTSPGNRADGPWRRDQNEQLLTLGDAGIDAVCQNTASDDQRVSEAAIEAIVLSAEKKKAVYNEKLAARMLELLQAPAPADPQAKFRAKSARFSAIRYLFAEPNREHSAPKVLPLLDENTMPDYEVRSEIFSRLLRVYPELGALSNTVRDAKYNVDTVRQIIDLASGTADVQTRIILAMATAADAQTAKVGREMFVLIKPERLSVDPAIAAYPKADAALKESIVRSLARQDVLNSSDKAGQFLTGLLDSKDRNEAEIVQRAMDNSEQGRHLSAPYKTFEHRFAHAEPVDVAAYYEKEAQHGGGDVMTGPLGYRVVKSPQYSKPEVAAAVQKLLTAHAIDRAEADRMLLRMFDNGTPDEQWVAAQVLGNHVYGRPRGPATLAKIAKLTGEPAEWTDIAGNYRQGVCPPSLVPAAVPPFTPPATDTPTLYAKYGTAAWCGSAAIVVLSMLSLMLAAMQGDKTR